MVMTDGRGECLRRTIASVPDSWWPVIATATIVDDSCDPKYRAFLRRRFPNLDQARADFKLGFGGAIRLGWSCVPPTATHVVHLEDDFEIDPSVDLANMVRILDSAPHLAQLVLKRQAWNESEKAAGGIVECWPELYGEVETPFGWYTEHRLFFSTNPSVYRRSLTELGWPEGAHSEQTFTDRLLLGDEAVRFAFLGRKFDPPLVTHIGGTRVGTGY